MKRKVNPVTGGKELEVDIEDIRESENIPLWGHPRGVDMFNRISPMVKYVKKQQDQDLWLYNRKMLTGVATEVLAVDDSNNVLYGINFASADYLGLAQHPFAKQAAIKAVTDFGVNSAGGPQTFGITKYYAQLRDELADFWGVKGLLLYSAGWLSGFGVIKALINEHDYIIMDNLSHTCLQEGANAATDQVIKFPHLNHAAMVKTLRQTRKKDPNAAILVVTEGLFSMDSDTPDLNEVQKVCKQCNAFLLIDSAHDFGCMGPGGKGFWAEKVQDLSNVILIGTGSKCLSTNIGFVGCDNPSVIEYLKNYSTAYKFTTAINPAQAATSLSNLRILRSELGNQLRRKVMSNYRYLRTQLQAKGHKIYGNPCPILPLHIGNEVICRLVCRLMMDRGVHANGMEYPVVMTGQARLRVNLMPQHTKEHLDTFISTFEICLTQATKVFKRGMQKFKQKQLKTASKL